MRWLSEWCEPVWYMGTDMCECMITKICMYLQLHHTQSFNGEIVATVKEKKRGFPTYYWLKMLPSPSSLSMLLLSLLLSLNFALESHERIIVYISLSSAMQYWNSFYLLFFNFHVNKRFVWCCCFSSLDISLGRNNLWPKWITDI